MVGICILTVIVSLANRLSSHAQLCSCLKQRSCFLHCSKILRVPQPGHRRGSVALTAAVLDERRLFGNGHHLGWHYWKVLHCLTTPSPLWGVTKPSCILS